MSRSNKAGSVLAKRRITPLLFLLAFILTISGCNKAVMDVPTLVESAAEHTVNPYLSSPIKIPYLVKNRLEEKYTESPNMQGFDGRSLSLGGLKDSTVEKAINDKLHALYAEVRDAGVPPYRGIKRMIPESSALLENSVMVSLPYSYDNVISVLVRGNRLYGSNQYVGLFNTLNIDLNTGKEIPLKDIFTDDVDYLSILNGLITKKLQNSQATEESYYIEDRIGAKMVSPFRGIQEDQKYFLFDGGLAIILDYDNPEFDVGFFGSFLYIHFHELGDCIAVTKRYHNEAADLFQSASPDVKSFLAPFAIAEVSEEKTERLGNVDIYLMSRYSTSHSPSILDKIHELMEPDEERIREMNASDAPDAHYSQNIWTIEAGEYTTIAKYVRSSVGSFFDNRYEYYVYDANSHQLTLEELFVEGFPYEAFIRKALSSTLSQMPGSASTPFDTLYAHLNFSIDQTGLSFSSNTFRNGEGEIYPVNFSLSYEEIGCNNLKIFH